MHPEPTQHHDDHSAHVSPLALGLTAGALGLTLAPYVLPLIGQGSPKAAEDIMHFIGGHAGSVEGFGNGLAGFFQSGLSQIPIIGGALTSTELVSIPLLGVSVASGALVSMAVAATVGIGGMLLANYLQKREANDGAMHWSKIIRTASLATSILISLPGLLTGVSVGITFLASLVSPSWGSFAALYAQQTLGGVSMNMGALGSISAVLPHLLTCGTAIVPVALALFLGKKPKEKTHETAAGQSTNEPAFELVSCAMPAKDQPCQMSFRLHDPTTGQSLAPDTLETTFTKKFHLMLVDQTLSEYHHLHPTFDASSGLFTCEFTPRTTQPFTTWCDFTPKATGKPVRALANLPAMRSVCLPARISTASDVSAAGITAHVTSDAPLTMGKDSILRVQLRDEAGKPISTLGAVMGAYAHLAGFSADKQHFIHTHPITPLGAPIRNGTLEFHVTPEHAGLSKFFLQINHDGQEVIIPFGRAIAPNLSYRERVSAPSPSPHQHAMA